MAFQINSRNQLITVIQKLLVRRNKNKFNLKKIGRSILKKTVIEITEIFKNEIKKA